MNRTFEIPAENLTRLTDKLDTLIRKAIKLGFEPPAYSVGPAYEKEVSRREEANDFRFDGEEDLDFPVIQEFVTYHNITVSGESPKIAGWSFVAVCDYAEMPVIIRALSNVSIPVRYRECGPICEHCKLARDRHECCVLVHEDGRFIQVGKSCLKDFLGHKSPERLAEMAELLRDLEDECGGYEGGEPIPDPALLTVLMWTSSVISRQGWCPKFKEDYDPLTNPNGRIATASIVGARMAEYARCLKMREQFKFPLPTKSDYDRAKFAVEYACNLPGSSEYELNVKAIAARSGVSGRNFGIACSIMGSYDRETAKKTENLNSEFVGTMGKKVNCVCTKKTCKCAPIKVFVARSISLPDYGYGVSYINIMRDVAGNTLTWKSGTCLSTGAEYLLSGTVKEHENTEKYGKQTILTRCKAEQIKHEVDDSIAA